jgi:hypothetical protein
MTDKQQIEKIELNKPFIVEENGVFFIVEYIRTPLTFAYNEDEIKRRYKALLKKTKSTK